MSTRGTRRRSDMGMMQGICGEYDDIANIQGDRGVDKTMNKYTLR